MQMLNFLKICTMGTKLLHADRWTDTEKLNGWCHTSKLTVTCWNFVNMPQHIASLLN